MRNKKFIAISIFLFLSGLILAQTDFFNYGSTWRSSAAGSLYQALEDCPSCVLELEQTRGEDTLYSRIHELTNLEKLEFGSCSYGDNYYVFPKEYCYLPHLREIKLDMIAGPVPEELGKMKSLRKFDGTTLVGMSELDSLEEIDGYVPPLPWLGNFKGLKRLTTQAINAEQLSKLQSLEFLDVRIGDCNLEFCSAIAKLKNLKELKIRCGYLKNDQVVALFSCLDQLPHVKKLLLNIETPDDGLKITEYYPSSLLSRVTSLELAPVFNLDAVLPDRMDSLQNLILHFRVGDGKPAYGYQKFLLSSTAPEDLLKRLPPLKKLTIFIQNGNQFGRKSDYGIDESRLHERWMNGFANDPVQCELDSLLILYPGATNSFGYQGCGDDWYLRRDYGKTSFCPYFPNQILSMIGRQQKLKHLTILGCLFPELSSLADSIALIPSLKSLRLDLLTLDCLPLPIAQLNKFQQQNCFQFIDELADYYEKPRYVSTFSDNKGYMAWKLLTTDILYHNYIHDEDIGSDMICFGVVEHKIHIHKETTVPTQDWLPDSLPLCLPLFTESNRNGQIPFMIWPEPKGIRWEYPSVFLQTHDHYRDVRGVTKWHIDDEQFKKGYFEFTDDFGKERVEWYSNGAVKRVTNSNDVWTFESRWTESGQLSYIYNKWKNEYKEAEWDENGNISWFRLGKDKKNRLVELHFYPNGRLKSEGWIKYKIHAGKWYYFDENGNRK